MEILVGNGTLAADISDEYSVSRAENINKALQILGMPYYCTCKKQTKKQKKANAALQLQWHKVSETCDVRYPNVGKTSESVVTKYLWNHGNIRMYQIKERGVAYAEEMVALLKKKAEEEAEKLKAKAEKTKNPKKKAELVQQAEEKKVEVEIIDKRQELIRKRAESKAARDLQKEQRKAEKQKAAELRAEKRNNSKKSREEKKASKPAKKQIEQVVPIVNSPALPTPANEEKDDLAKMMQELINKVS